MSTGAVVIPFVKASACGNDFLLIDGNALDPELAVAELPSISRRICDRHNGVGADGVEWMYRHPTADIEIRLINNDGTEAEISGNGTRCVAAYLYAERKKEKLAIQTGAGLKICTLIGQSDGAYEFEAAMGEAVIANELALKLENENVEEIRGIPVSMGNPHLVVFVGELASNWREQAARIQRSSQFPDGVNVEMVLADREHDVRVRFFERGVGETQSSGTGSCASAVAAISTGRAESPINVHTPGGMQTVRTEGNWVFLRGSARLICRGEFFLT
ncbi:MAG TPA: diaminopimelate epimerase [Candidatus Aquilonibacter sp.]|nr:diaminopimelate epimerase [Candidatus Aquilonibacter sp.]